MIYYKCDMCGEYVREKGSHVKIANYDLCDDCQTKIANFFDVARRNREYDIELHLVPKEEAQE